MGEKIVKRIFDIFDPPLIVVDRVETYLSRCSTCLTSAIKLPSWTSVASLQSTLTTRLFFVVADLQWVASLCPYVGQGVEDLREDELSSLILILSPEGGVGVAATTVGWDG